MSSDSDRVSSGEPKLSTPTNTNHKNNNRSNSNAPSSSPSSTSNAFPTTIQQLEQQEHSQDSTVNNNLKSAKGSSSHFLEGSENIVLHHQHTLLVEGMSTDTQQQQPSNNNDNTEALGGYSIPIGNLMTMARQNSNNSMSTNIISIDELSKKSETRQLTKSVSFDRLVSVHFHPGEHHHDEEHYHFENPLLKTSTMSTMPSIESNLSRVASSAPLSTGHHSDIDSVGEYKSSHPAQFFDQQCFMEWKNITFPMGSPNPILKNISGFVAPGKLTAILGPLGSGKSTLLKILSGRGARSYGGDIHINGQLAMNSEKQFLRIDSGRFKSLVSFVAKDFTPSNMSLTVKEILQFAVRLKLPSKSNNPLWTTREERLAIVLSCYGLRGKENCLYSSLSSGEKRRLSIAAQNVLFHRIVLLEYPTEFMEFGESFLLIKRMKKLADMGISVVVCLHKPSVQEIEIFDYVSILNKGRQIYFGKSRDIITYFNHAGVRFPHERQNTVASVFELLLLHDMHNSNNEDDKKYAIGHMSELELRRISELDKEYEDKMETFYIPQKHQEELPFLQNTIESIQTEKYYSNYWFSILILLQRIYTVKFRNWKTEILSPLLEKIIISTVIGILFLQIEPTNMSMKGKIFSFLNLNISLTFGLGLKTLVGQIPNLMQERTSTSYRISAFYIAKSIEDTIDFTVYPTVFGIIVYFMTGLDYNPSRIFSFIFIFALFNLTSMSVAQALVSLIPVPSFLNFISPVISLTFMLLSGAYGITKTTYIYWMGYFSYLYYAFRALAINEFNGDIINVPPNENGTIIIPAGQYTNGTLFLEKAYGITEPYYMMWVYTGILLLYFIFCKILAYIGLRFVYGKKSQTLKRMLKNFISHFTSCCNKQK